MAHNCNTFNGARPNDDGTVEMPLDLSVTQRLSMTRANFGNSAYDYANNMRFAFIGTSGFCLLFTSSVTSVTATTPNTPLSNTNFTQAYTISGAGTYLLIANVHFEPNGASATLRWRDTANIALGPKTRHHTSTMRFANKVWGVVTFTGTSRTVFVQVTEESGSLRTNGQGSTTSVTYVQILKVA